MAKCKNCFVEIPKDEIENTKKGGFYTVIKCSACRSYYDVEWVAGGPVLKEFEYRENIKGYKI